MSGERQQLVRLSVILSVVLLSVVVACGGGGGDGQPRATDANDGDDGAGVIHITLFEWSVKSKESLAGVPAGTIVFDARNNGMTPHELAVIASDRDPGDLPVSGGVVDEGEAGKLQGRTSKIDPGDSEELRLNLAPGKYVLICNIAAHYQQGMHAPLVVE